MEDSLTKEVRKNALGLNAPKSAEDAVRDLSSSDRLSELGAVLLTPGNPVAELLRSMANPKPMDQVLKANPNFLAKKPSICRMVVYHPTEGDCYQQDISTEDLPALILRVHTSGAVTLKVFTEALGFAKSSIFEGLGPGKWSWPEKI